MLPVHPTAAIVTAATIVEPMRVVSMPVYSLDANVRNNDFSFPGRHRAAPLENHPLLLHPAPPGEHIG